MAKVKVIYDDLGFPDYLIVYGLHNANCIDNFSNEMSFNAGDELR